MANTFLQPSSSPTRKPLFPCSTTSALQTTETYLANTHHYHNHNQHSIPLQHHDHGVRLNLWVSCPLLELWRRGCFTIPSQPYQHFNLLFRIMIAVFQTNSFGSPCPLLELWRKGNVGYRSGKRESYLRVTDFGVCPQVS